MKKFIVFALAMVLVLGLAGIAFAGVSGSAHDLASGKFTSGVSSTSQICVFCHHPHRGSNVSTNSSNALLWNMDDFASSVYTAYSSASLNNTTTSVNSSAPQSYLCMACHDGSIAAGALAVAPRDGTDIQAIITLNTDAALGTTLVDDHPVNMLYSGNDAGLQSGASGNVTGAISSNTYPLYSGVMQCGTCHDVHAGGTDSKSSASNLDFMRGDIIGSQICRDCHTNK